jgi:hypothetical protein
VPGPLRTIARLVGKCAEQSDFRFGKSSDFLAMNDDGSNGAAVAKYGYAQRCAKPHRLRQLLTHREAHIAL